MANFREMARTAASKYGVDPNVFERQIAQESQWNPNAESSAGALGLAQLMPVHWGNVDPTDPAASLDYAARLMAGYLGQYNGDFKTALAAYNAGPGNVAEYGGVPPFAETQTYVQNILGGQNTTGGNMAGPSTAPDQVREVWLDAEGHVVAPNTPGATRHKIYFYPNGDTYKSDWKPNAPTGGVFGIGSTPPGPNDGSWSDPYWVSSDTPKTPAVDEVPANTSAPYVVTRDAQGELTKKNNPNYIPPAVTPNKTNPNKVLHLPTGDVVIPNEFYDPTAAQELQAKIESAQAQAAYYRAQAANVGVHAPPAPQYPSTITHGNKAFTVDPYTGQISESYDFGQAPPPEITPYQQAQEAGLNERSQATIQAQAEQARLQREADTMRNNLTNRGALTGHLNSATLQAVPYTVDPSWNTYLGFEQGGPMAQLYRMGGGTNYQPPVLPKMQFDPEAAWRAAQGLIQ